MNPEAEVAVSRDHAIVLQPGQQKDSVSKRSKTELLFTSIKKDRSLPYQSFSNSSKGKSKIGTFIRFGDLILSFSIKGARLQLDKSHNTLGFVDIVRKGVFLFCFVFESQFVSRHPRWSAVAQSRLTENSASWVQAIFLLQSLE